VAQLVEAGRSRVLFPMGSLAIFTNLKPSGCNRALGSALPLAEVNTREYPGGKGGNCVGLTTTLLATSTTILQSVQSECDRMSVEKCIWLMSINTYQTIIKLCRRCYTTLSY